MDDEERTEFEEVAVDAHEVVGLFKGEGLLSFELVVESKVLS